MLPWEEDETAPFNITIRRVPENSTMVCAGCKALLGKEQYRAPHDILLVRDEKDYISGTKRQQWTPAAAPRRYHPSISCVRQRHGYFPKNWVGMKFVIKEDRVFQLEASPEQREIAKMFVENCARFHLDEDD